MSGGEHFNFRSLEPLNRKPTLWRGLTSDELVTSIGVCLGIPVVVCTVFSAIFFKWVIGFVIGLLVGFSMFWFVSGYIERKKTKHGSVQFWIMMKKAFQKRGLGQYGYEIDEKRWSTSLSRARAKHPRLY